MTKKITLLLLLPVILFTFYSCETEVDIDTDWKEITIVYGLLNQLDTAHYFRINKAFLGGNALQMAKIEDSSSYRNALEVKLEGWDLNSVVQTIFFDTSTFNNKDTGIFYNPYMVIYKGVGQLNPELQYRLFVKNTISGHEVTSKTNLVRNFIIKKPVAGGRLTLFRGFNTAFGWTNGVNARRYEPQVRFHFWEVPAGTQDTIPRYIDWALTTVNSNNLQGEGEIEISFSNDGFYDFVKSKLTDNFDGRRLCGEVDFIISAGGDEYDTYMKVNGPSYSLVQDRPEYTNVENGLGLFSSRYSIFRVKRLDPRAEDEIILLDVKFVKNPQL
ncbi:MAG: DUF4249 family protein [Bacteroidales bacterium]|nr:DUF4249 family protein [Bacteroidales bacterium]